MTIPPPQATRYAQTLLYLGLRCGMSARGLAPFPGSQRSLVLAFDFGTTFSGIAYSILDPGQVPKIQSVTRFPGQENGDFKIPSIICYAKDGQVCAIGAEARESNIEPELNDGTLVFVEWFKLYLCPASMRPSGLTIPLLPPEKTAVGVIADFLAYLFQCVKDYIQQTHASGESLWKSVQGRIDVILSHPNGWEVSQHVKMREAAVLAGLIPEGIAGRARLHFVTEGEASLHYCVNSGLATEAVKDGSSVMIVDCGGGTVDLTTYKFVTAEPIRVEEIASPACILQGSTRINMRFKEFLIKKLESSRFGKAEEIAAMMERFEKSTKPTFKEPNVRSFVKFGGLRDSDPKAGIVRGSLSVDGKDMEGFFQPSIDAISDAIRAQKMAASAPVSTAFLVGGFAASTWFYLQLKDILRSDGIELCRPDSHTSKAVSEGAALYFLMNFVTARISRLTYGIEFKTRYIGSNTEHQKRSGKLRLGPEGYQEVHGCFQVFISKGKRLVEHEEIRYPFYSASESWSGMEEICIPILCYHGTDKMPSWMDEDPASYSTLCTIRVDATGFAEARVGLQGQYFSASYVVVLKVGLTELQAFMSWKENGEDRWSPAEIIPVDG